MRLRSFVLLWVVMLLIMSGSSAIAQQTNDDEVCPLGQGFWKNNPDSWTVTSLQLGSQFYTQAELLTILNTPPAGDASLILAHQLIALKLNLANGVNPQVISAIMVDADGLLAQFTGKLPYNIAPSSDAGNEMVLAADTFDAYNRGLLSSGCDDLDDDGSVPTPVVTEEPVPESTEVVDDGDMPVIIVIEGPVTAINVNIVTIYNFNIIVNDDNPILTVIQIGDVIRVEGELDDDNVLIVDDDDDFNISIVIVAINITIVNVDVFINNDGSVYRDDSDCSNPPPSWAPANGWRRKCEGGGDDDDDDDDDNRGRGRGRGDDD